MTDYIATRILTNIDKSRRLRQLIWYLAHRFTNWDRRLAQRYLSGARVPKLHIGCGKHLLFDWLNMDYLPVFRDALYIDARRAFRFSDNTFQYIFSEHIIEHISYGDGLKMLAECLRILKPSGRIRISTPDLAFIISLYGVKKSVLQKQYIEWAAREFLGGGREVNEVFVINNLMRNWGHTFIYDENTLRNAMENVGFTNIVKCELGQSEDSELCHLENETRLPAGLLRLETVTLEGIKAG
jgi:predicted SAM-dependent methyltransferase